MPTGVKGKVYRTVVRPVLIYDSEAWTLRRREEERLERTEMRMLRWILGLTLRDRKRNDDIRCILGVACITDKVREARLRWYGIFNCEKRMIVSSGSWRQTWVDNGAEEDRERDGSTSSSTTWRTAAQRGGCQESSWMEKENPCGWPLTWGIHSPKEREREIRNDHHLTRKPSYWQRTVLAQVSSSFCMKSTVWQVICALIIILNCLLPSLHSWNDH